MKFAYTQKHNTRDILQVIKEWYSATSYITFKNQNQTSGAVITVLRPLQSKRFSSFVQSFRFSSKASTFRRFDRWPSQRNAICCSHSPYQSSFVYLSRAKAAYVSESTGQREITRARLTVASAPSMTYRRETLRFMAVL